MPSLRLLLAVLILISGLGPLFTAATCHARMSHDMAMGSESENGDGKSSHDTDPCRAGDHVTLSFDCCDHFLDTTEARLTSRTELSLKSHVSSGSFYTLNSSIVASLRWQDLDGVRRIKPPSDKRRLYARNESFLI